MGYKRLRFNNLQQAGLFIPKVAEYIRRCLQQLGSLVGLILFYQQFDNEHSRFFHSNLSILGQGELTEQQIERLLLGSIKRRGRCQKGCEHMLHVIDSEQSQFLQLAGLSMIDKAGSLKRCATERATVIALNGECSLRNQVPAWKRRTLEPSLLAKDIGNKCNQMVGQCLTSRHVPTFDKRCPVEFHAHHVVDTLGDLCKAVCRNCIQGMKQFFADTETILLQCSYECHYRHRSLRHHVDFITVDVEEHCVVT